MNDDVLVRAVALARTYGSNAGRVTALADATFTIRPSDRVAIMGPSGSGKTTLLHLIGALDSPTAGEINWPSLGAASTLRPGPIAMAFQGPSLLPPLSVVENVALPILLAGGTEKDSIDSAVRLLDLFELRELAEKLPEEISGGQQQRAGLARALAGGPNLLLADEPTGQQDHTTGHRMMEALMLEVDRADTSVVIATHDPIIASYCKTRWSVENGRLITETPAWA
ncbi:MAG: lipoprotein-releasing system ATP-binding protein [Actinomycetota bacterium]|jgi:ABC-type lipoprotein export system ATPase subunit|nr:lipoprotein-releasing system ATP-binding protein [Actinomycetota bacterium]